MSTTVYRPVIDAEVCKGCGLCARSCPRGCLAPSSVSNAYGVKPMSWSGAACVGCGTCFIMCPEPWALKVVAS